MTRLPKIPLRHWHLNPRVVFLNHGSFGACPRAVLQQQTAWRTRLERDPVQFLARELEGLLDQSRHALAEFVGCHERELVFVPNATTGVNTVLCSQTFRAGDELLVTDHEYNACRNALDEVARRKRLRVNVVSLPFPGTTEEALVDTVLARLTRRTRLALLDHVTSPTAIVLPIARLCRELRQRGVEVLVDGAHALGMLPLELSRLGASYYTGNAHKWLCAPKGAAFLWVDPSLQKRVRPLVISHGANSRRRDRSRFLLEFGWTGTGDPTPWLCIPAAIRAVGNMVAGGWPAVMERNHRLVVAGRTILLDRLGISTPVPEALLGCMAAIPLPRGRRGEIHPPLYLDPLQVRLWEDHRIEVPVIHWPAPPQRLLRISAAPYNGVEDFRKLARALQALYADGDL